jgi:hypothetical protein
LINWQSQNLKECFCVCADYLTLTRNGQNSGDFCQKRLRKAKKPNKTPIYGFAANEFPKTINNDLQKFIRDWQQPSQPVANSPDSASLAAWKATPDRLLDSVESLLQVSLDVDKIFRPQGEAHVIGGNTC